MSVGDGRDNFDPLDELLAAARWPEVSEEVDERLRAAWGERSGRRRMSAWWVRGVAAGLVVAIGAWAVVVVQKREGGVVVKKIEAPVAARPVVQVAVRDANPAELAVALTAAREQGGTTRREVREVGKAAINVAACLEAIAKKRGADAALKALKAAREHGRVVEELFARLDDPKMEIRLAAAKALGYVDGPVVTRRLAEMVEENRNRREALAALMQSEGREAREYVRYVQRTEELNAALRSAAAQVRSF